MAFQTFENDKNNRSQIKRKNLKNEIRSTWLGRWFAVQTLDEADEDSHELERQIKEIRQLFRDDL